MASLKKAAQCIGIAPDFRVVKDFFGYVTGAPKTLSLLTQMRLLQGKHIHLNIIRTANFKLAELKRIDAAIQFAREVYGPVGIGIGRISRFRVPQGGYEIIMDWDVALDLWDSWSADNDGIDAFFCFYLNGPESGRSPEPGSCDKDGKDSGLFVGVLDNLVKGQESLGHALAHEIGHFLDLAHDDDQQNIMYKSVPNGAQLRGGQVGAIRLHCSMRGACQL